VKVERGSKAYPRPRLETSRAKPCGRRAVSGSLGRGERSKHAHEPIRCHDVLNTQFLLKLKLWQERIEFVPSDHRVDQVYKMGACLKSQTDFTGRVIRHSQ
jgi:hypothetical protein